MKLQIALDDVTLEGALELVKKVRDYIDIIEIGTFCIRIWNAGCPYYERAFSGQRDTG